MLRDCVSYVFEDCSIGSICRYFNLTRVVRIAIRPLVEGIVLLSRRNKFYLRSVIISTTTGYRTKLVVILTNSSNCELVKCEEGRYDCIAGYYQLTSSICYAIAPCYEVIVLSSSCSCSQFNRTSIYIYAITCRYTMIAFSYGCHIAHYHLYQTNSLTTTFLARTEDR